MSDNNDTVRFDDLYEQLTGQIADAEELFAESTLLSVMEAAAKGDLTAALAIWGLEQANGRDIDPHSAAMTVRAFSEALEGDTPPRPD